MKKQNTFIFIDAANFHYFLQKADWKINWKKFRKYFEENYGETSFYYYEGVPSKAQYFDIHPDKTLKDFLEAKKGTSFSDVIKERTEIPKLIFDDLQTESGKELGKKELEFIQTFMEKIKVEE